MNKLNKCYADNVSILKIIEDRIEELELIIDNLRYPYISDEMVKIKELKSILKKIKETG